MSDYFFNHDALRNFPQKHNNVAHIPRINLSPALAYIICILKSNLHSRLWPSCSGMLFQGQVTRAQEAEENYVIKRELAVVRQQCNTASESLEKAQDTIRELQQQKVKDQPHGLCTMNVVARETNMTMSNLIFAHICVCKKFCLTAEEVKLYSLIID